MSPSRVILTIGDMLGVLGTFMAALFRAAPMAVARILKIPDKEQSELPGPVGLARCAFATNPACWLAHKTPAFRVRFGNEIGKAAHPRRARRDGG